MDLLMSTPCVVVMRCSRRWAVVRTTHWCPRSVMASPLSPLPHPMSSSSLGVPSSGRASSSMARCVSLFCWEDVCAASTSDDQRT